MRLFLTMLYDSLLETIDRKVFYVLLALSAILILVAASIGFEPTPLETVISGKWDAIDQIAHLRLDGSTTFHVDPILRVEAVEALPEGGYEADVRIERPGDARRLAAAIEESRRALAGEKVPERAEALPPSEVPLTPSEGEGLFRELAGRDGFGFRSAEPVGEGRFLVVLDPPHPYEMAGAGRLTLLFGKVGFEVGETSFANVLLHAQNQLASNVAGWIGILIAIIVTAGFFPNMLQEGSIDLLLSKPVHRIAVFFAKYLGGLLFVFLNALFLIGGIWLAMSVRSGFYNFGFLATILNVTVLFAVLYSISVFWAVMTRSQVLSILMSITFWAISAMVQAAVSAVLFFQKQGEDIPAWVVGGVKAIYYVVPNTSAFHMLNIYSVSRAPISDAARERFLASSGYSASMHGLSLEWSFASTAIFTLLVLGFTAWRFSKRDF